MPISRTLIVAMDVAVHLIDTALKIATDAHSGQTDKAKNEVGVFLRGLRGVTPAQTQTRLAPHAEVFERLVGECRRIGEADHHPLDRLDIDTADAANWDRAIDWLHARAHAFLSATTQLFDASTVPGVLASEPDR